MQKHYPKTLILCVALSLVVFPSSAWATLESDQSPASEEEISKAFEEGTLSLEVKETSSDGSSPKAATAKIGAVTATEYAGDSLFETAIAEAKAAYPQGAQSAILVSGPGDSWIDALSVAGLAATKGPILFTWKTSLNEATKQALLDLGVKSVIIIGGTAAVSEAVVPQLQEAGIAVESRLAGADCFETQIKIYEYGVKNSCWAGDIAFVATAGNYGDALSISPVAYARKAPIFLTDSTKSLPNAQKDALIAASTQLGYFGTVVAVGGKDAVAETTLGFLDFISILAKGDGVATRLAGQTQYETSSAIAQWAVDTQGFSWNNLAFATGLSPWDALAGSVLQGSSKSVLLLASDYATSTITAAAQHASSINSVRFFGGKAALPTRVRMGVADAFGFPYAALPGFKVYVDAGHGWNDNNAGSYDPGACGNGYEEAALNRELAGMVGNILRNTYGVETFVNDDGGWYKLRHAEAVAQGCDALVSIHFNSGGGSGTESLIHDYNASFLSPPWQGQIHPRLIEGIGLRDRGQKAQEVAILGGYLPATLLEICFIDSGYDMDTYASRKVEIAYKIAEGIVA
ncbi:MAG: cell wall-binding repeat-containing protein [Raoultibacter sp.]